MQSYKAAVYLCYSTPGQFYLSHTETREVAASNQAGHLGRAFSLHFFLAKRTRVPYTKGYAPASATQTSPHDDSTRHTQLARGVLHTSDRQDWTSVPTPNAEKRGLAAHSVRHDCCFSACSAMRSINVSYSAWAKKICR